MSKGPVGLIVLGALLQGGGMGAAWAFLVRRATALVDKTEGDRTASAIPTVQRFGYAVGAALVGILANAAGFGEDSSMTVARFVSVAIFSASLLPAGLGLLAVLRFIRFRERAA
jgi:Na+/melibiose symporter-like transporter